MVYLKKLKCQGLYSYEEPFELETSNHMLIVGPNNSGKSNFFKLIGLLIDTFLGRKRLGNYEIANNAFNSILEIYLTLSKEEAKKIVDFFSFYPEKPNGHSNFFEYENYNQLIDLLDTLSIKLLWEREAEGYGSEPYVEIEFSKIGLKFYSYMFSGLRASNYFPSEQKEGTFSNEANLYELLCHISEQSDTKTIVSQFFKKNEVIGVPQIRIDRNTKISDKGKQTLTNLYSYLEISLEANQEVQFIELLATIFRKGIIYSSDRRGINGPSILDYAELLKIEDNSGTIRENDKVDYNALLELTAFSKAIEPTKILKSDGNNLAAFLFGLKNSQNYAERKSFEKIQEAFRKLFQSEKLGFDIILKYHTKQRYRVWQGNPQSKPQLPIIVVVDDKLNREFPISETGAGLSEAIYLLTLGFGIENSIILLDEPSVNLHPPLMRSLLNLIQDHAKTNQFMIITHSPELVRFELFEKASKIFYVRRIGTSSKIRTLVGNTKEWFDRDRNRLRHQIDPRIFFGKCVILTEGDSDKNLLSGVANYLESRNSQVDVTKNDVIITSVDGKNNFKKYEDLMKTLGIPYLIIADLDAKSLLKTGGAINKNGIKIVDSKVIIEYGNLEDLMKEIDVDAYSKAVAENGKSKPAVAYSFTESVSSNHPERLNLFRDFLMESVKRSQGREEKLSQK